MLCVAAAAMLFASKGLFGKALYQRGVGFELLVAVRSVMALPLFAWVGLRRGPRAPIVSGDDEAQTPPLVPTRRRRAVHARSPPRSWPASRAITSARCVDFWALTMIDASVERVLLFSYPAMVVMIDSVRTRRAPESAWSRRCHRPTSASSSRWAASTSSSCAPTCWAPGSARSRR
jgi:hypothetical protein